MKRLCYCIDLKFGYLGYGITSLIIEIEYTADQCGAFVSIKNIAFTVGIQTSQILFGKYGAAANCYGADKRIFYDVDFDTLFFPVRFYYGFNILKVACLKEIFEIVFNDPFSF